MPDKYLPVELRVIAEFENLTSEFKKKFFFTYYIVSPAIYLKMMLVHSNTSNLFVFQEKYRGVVLLNFLRYAFTFLNIALYAALFINLFSIRDIQKKLIVVYTPLIYLILYCFIEKMFEQRYMLPLLPILLIGLSIPVKYFLEKMHFIKETKI